MRTSSSRTVRRSLRQPSPLRRTVTIDARRPDPDPPARPRDGGGRRRAPRRRYTQGGRTPCLSRGDPPHGQPRPCRGPALAGDRRARCARRPAPDALGPEGGPWAAPGLVVDRSSVGLEAAAFDVDLLALRGGARRRSRSPASWRRPAVAIALERSGRPRRSIVANSWPDSRCAIPRNSTNGSSLRRRRTEDSSRRSSNGWRAVRQQLEPGTRPYRPRGAGSSSTRCHEPAHRAPHGGAGAVRRAGGRPRAISRLRADPRSRARRRAAGRDGRPRRCHSSGSDLP